MPDENMSQTPRCEMAWDGPETLDADAALALHCARYPVMGARDALKLLYQRAFGCGHFVTDFDACFARVRDESAVCAEAATLLEPIGNGYSRLYLGSARQAGISPWLVARLFFLSAERGRGSAETLLREAELAKRHFHGKEIDALIAEAVDSDFAPFSHTDAYRRAYRPAYRVILSKFGRILPLLDAIDRKRREKPVAVAVDGRCGAGKTTLAAALSDVFCCPVVHMDDFFLPPEMRGDKRLLSPGGNVHIERFCGEVAPRIGRGEAFTYGVFDCGQGRVTRRRAIPASDILIVEGSYSLHPKIAGLYDIKVFCDIGKEAQLMRLAARDPERLDAFINRWIPMEEAYFSAYSVRDTCGFILSAGR